MFQKQHWQYFFKHFLSRALRQKLSFALSILAVLLGFITFAGLSSISPFEVGSKVLLTLLVADITVLLLLAVLIVKKLVEIC